VQQNVYPIRTSVHNRVRNRAVGLLFVGLTSANAYSQGASQGEALRDVAFLSGLGVVGNEIAGETTCAPNESGNREISLHVSIGGPVASTLEWRTGPYGSCQAFLVQNGQREQLYRGWDTPEISYESAAVVYYEHRDGFARVFERTAPPGFWVRISDLPDGRLRPWSDLLVASPHTYLGYEGLGLHMQPTEDSTILLTLRERRVHESRVHQIIPTGELAGAWGKFDVIEFTSDFNVMARTSDSAQTGNRWQGWLHLLTAEAAPRFWFYTRD
jgi:hypothetical protein